MLKALAEPARVRIVECLLDGPKNVSEIAELLDSDVANVSHHLRMMQNIGVLSSERDGKYIVYSLAPAILRARKGSRSLKVLEFGCCRIELGEPRSRKSS